MSRILKVSDQQAIQVLAAKGFSLRWISRELNINRRTVARSAPAAKCTTLEAKVTAGSRVQSDRPLRQGPVFNRTDLFDTRDMRWLAGRRRLGRRRVAVPGLVGVLRKQGVQFDGPL